MTDMLVAILDVNGLLRLKTYPLSLQFDAKRILINTFEQSGAKRAVHVHRRSNNLSRQWILFYIAHWLYPYRSVPEGCVYAPFVLPLVLSGKAFECVVNLALPTKVIRAPFVFPSVSSVFPLFLCGEALDCSTPCQDFGRNALTLLSSVVR